MISRHFLLVAVAVLAAAAHAQGPTVVPQPCPFDCAPDMCNTDTQTCTDCVSGFQLSEGRCHLEQCNHAQAHKARNATDGSRDDSMAEWRVTAVDGTTHTVTVEVIVPPRFHCDVTGHALTDALAWEDWLDAASETDKCPGVTETPLGVCGPTDNRWTPVLMLGRESDEPLESDIKGWLRLPRDANDTSCVSAYRDDADAVIDLTAQTYNLVTSYDQATRKAIMTLPLMDLADPDDEDLHCSELREVDLVSGIDVAGEAGKRFQYWSKSVSGTITTWRFDATLCYVDDAGEQSVCPFSSPVWEMTVNGITDGVSVTPAGTAELIYVPKCELYIRSAQIRYAGEIESRNATGEFEISVVCEGLQYKPDIQDIDHCQCERDGSGKCIILEESDSCDGTSCQVSAMFKSTTFNASDADFLQFACSNTAIDNAADLDDGTFVVEISHEDNECFDSDPSLNDCTRISNAKLFGGAPLQATDELRDQLGPYNDSNTHSIYAGLMKSNDLGVPAGEGEYFHQFNRTYLEFTTIRRVVGADQKNSFVMCAMMQPDALTGTIDPEDISYKFKITIQEVSFNVTWEDGRANTFTTLTELLAGNERWPSQWVWESQEDLALRREVIGRIRGRANAPCDTGGVCQVTPMQDHVYQKLDGAGEDQWDHIQENVDCVGISPFYLYSLLTLGEPEAIVSAAGVTLTTYHEYQGRYIKDAAGRRRLLQADGNDPTFASGRDDQFTGAFQWISKSDFEAEQQANNAVVTKEQAATTTSKSSSIPVMPIVIGAAAASMTCMFFAAFAMWRRRKQQPQQEKKLGPDAQFTSQEPRVVVQLDDIQLSQAGQV